MGPLLGCGLMGLEEKNIVFPLDACFLDLHKWLQQTGRMAQVRKTEKFDSRAPGPRFTGEFGTPVHG